MAAAQLVREKRDTLTIRQLKLVGLFAEGRTVSSIWKEAGYGAAISACEAANSRKVVEALEETRVEVMTKTGFAIEIAHKMYQQAYDKAAAEGNAKDMCSAVDGLVKLYGLAKG